MSEVGSHRRREARRFDRSALDELAAHHPDAVDLRPIDPTDPSDDPAAARARQVTDTLAALDAGAPLVIGGRLPDDVVGERRGRADVLVRAGRRPDGAWGYWPVVVAAHRSLDARRDQTLALRDDPEVAVVPLEVLRPDGVLDGSVGLPPENLVRRDRLALAHLWRLLEAAGRSADRPLAAVIGTERVAAWTDLGEREVLDAYDAAFAVRLEVVAADDPWPVPPVRVPECERCGWRLHCGAELDRLDSTSLVPGVGYGQWEALGSVGVHTRADLASLPHDPDCDDPRISALQELVAIDWLPSAIDQAWAATAGGGRPHLRRDAAPVELPEADVEIDLDMENALDGTVYLWGVLVDGEYRPVVDWDATGDEVASRVFLEFWHELAARAHAAWADGRSMACYVWHEHAEIGAMLAGAAAAERVEGAAGLAEAVRALTSAAPDDLDDADPLAPLRAVRFVDLLQVYRAACVHGSGYGLKVVAPLAGFGWDDDDASGAGSMLWHRAASSPDGDADVRDAAQRRLLRYNEDDVRATAAIRAWLRTTTLPRLPG